MKYQVQRNRTSILGTRAFKNRRNLNLVLLRAKLQILPLVMHLPDVPEYRRWLGGATSVLQIRNKCIEKHLATNFHTLTSKFATFGLVLPVFPNFQPGIDFSQMGLPDSESACEQASRYKIWYTYHENEDIWQIWFGFCLFGLISRYLLDSAQRK